MAVRDDEGGAACLAGRGNHTIDARRDLVGCLALGAAAEPHRPVGDRLADLFRRNTLVDAVIPLDEVRIDRGFQTEVE